MDEKIKEILKKCTTTYYTGLGERDEVNMELFTELLWKEAYHRGYADGVVAVQVAGAYER